MRRYVAVSLAALLFVTICLGPFAIAFATITDVTVREVMQAYDAVIQGQAPFTHISSDGSRTQTSFRTTVKTWDGYDFDGAEFTYTQFCVVDPDADGYPDIILELDEPGGYPFGFELLRYYQGTVYGYPFGLRAMEAITLEGDIEYSNSADEGGWYRISFDGEQMATTDICHSDAHNTGVDYYIGFNKVTKQQCQEYLNELGKKPVPVWLPFPTKNFHAVVEKF